ncbi:hypothetical protein DCS_05679 [Drechmeria coniospora]|uniref:Uncharacterized protein n=1 Tax=Drechmeria coniospora TaxID=98403 RepID=A0A151GNT9_DRECN|nr:hypothetical protein DCS_05679 [Drechmeria coniospora]KYK58662.1 hypothetical protein DCS_05679 [Drechmeria coniospora]
MATIRSMAAVGEVLQVTTFRRSLPLFVTREGDSGCRCTRTPCHTNGKVTEAASHQQNQRLPVSATASFDRDGGTVSAAHMENQGHGSEMNMGAGIKDKGCACTAQGILPSGKAEADAAQRQRLDLRRAGLGKGRWRLCKDARRGIPAKGGHKEMTREAVDLVKDMGSSRWPGPRLSRWGQDGMRVLGSLSMKNEIRRGDADDADGTF